MQIEELSVGMSCVRVCVRTCVYFVDNLCNNIASTFILNH